jgi:hypothetical protein
MTLIRVNDENIQPVIVKGSLILLIVMTFAGISACSLRFALSALAGGVLVLVNHCWLGSIMARILAGQAENATRYALIRYLLRLFLIALAVIVLFRLNVDIAGLFAGLSILVITTVLVSAYTLIHHKGESS